MTFFEKHRKVIVTIIVTVMIFLIMGISAIPFKNSFFLKNFVNTIFSPVRSIVSGISNGIGGFVNYLFEMKNLNEENDYLTKRVAELEHNYKATEDYKKENERLRELLALTEEKEADFEGVYASVIGLGADNWYSGYTINKGSLAGIEVGDVVISEQGVVGQISEVGLNWAVINSLISPSSSVGAKIVRSGDIAIVEGDFKLERDCMMKMTFINKDAQILTGDTIETSGLGESFPGGIPLGKVVNIVSDVSGVSKYAVVEPYVDFKNLKEVLIIKKQ